MPVAKLRGSCTVGGMNSEEGNDSLDTYIRQAVGREPCISFSRTVDSPVQWIQLLHALDQQDLPGWPFPSPLKTQMQKCDKCSREFCSPINYRRHIRVHRRSLNVDKESHKSRDLLGAFWDKLSLDEAKETVSFIDVTLEEVPGSSIIRALTSAILTSGFRTLPPPYVKAGSALLDIIQSRPFRLPISSQELFSILDDASERTFLCAGAAESMHKYVFDGEAGKIGLEMKNLIACISFLVEQRLVKAWIADKDAEALRCQKLLVEEEEAAHQRQAELLERKRLRKLRQKEQKAKEQANGEKVDLKDIPGDVLDSPSSAEVSSPSVESDSSVLETPTEHAPSPIEQPVQTWNADEDAYTEAQFELGHELSDSSAFPNAERRTEHRNGHRHLVVPRWQIPKSQRFGRNSFHSTQSSKVLKLEHMQKHVAPGDPRAAAPVVSCNNKVWSRKPKPENEDILKSRLLKEEEDGNQMNQNNSEVMIGSISVTLGNCTQQQDDGLIDAQEHAISKPTKSVSVQNDSQSMVAKHWRPVSRHETRVLMPAQNGSAESREDIIVGGKGNNRMVPSETCLRSCASGDNGYQNGTDFHPLVDTTVPLEGFLFSSNSAKAFLAQRWKEAISVEHVKLVLSPESEPPDTGNDSEVVKASSNHRCTVFGNPENVLANVESKSSDTFKAKLRVKPEKGATIIKYIPKQRAVT